MTRPAITIMSRLSASATFSWPTSTLPESASAICSVTSGTELPTMAAAVAYAAKALPKSSTNPPSSEGASTGRPTWRQYCQAVAPLFCGRLAPLGAQPVQGRGDDEHHQRDQEVQVDDGQPG